jgi:hypothetical protein
MLPFTWRVGDLFDFFADKILAIESAAANVLSLKLGINRSIEHSNAMGEKL